MGVLFLKYGFPKRPFARLADIPVEGSDWRGGAQAAPERICDLDRDDHVVMSASSRALLVRRRGTRCRAWIWLREPPCIQGRFYRLWPLVGGRFDGVLTHQASLAARCRNAVIVPHGGSWIRHAVDPMAPRSGRIAMIASNKASTEGHRLRHRIAAWSRTAAPDLACLGRGYRSIECKSEGHLPFMYSVVIENGSYPGYFTEKLVDCLLCGSVPIYWGDPEHARHFDPAGIIHCRSEDDVRRAILAADVPGFDSRLGARRTNAEVARRFADPMALVASALLARFG